MHDIYFYTGWIIAMICFILDILGKIEIAPFEYVFFFMIAGVYYRVNDK